MDNKLVTKTTYGGVDWHDSSEKSIQLTLDGKESSGEFLIPVDKLNEVILKDIASTLVDKDGREIADIEKVEEVLLDNSHTKSYTVPLPEGEKFIDDAGNVYYENEITFGWDDKGVFEIVESYWMGQATYYTWYYVDEVPANPVYFVYENFACPTKGVPSVERFYHEAFESLEEAKDYFNSFVCHDNDCNMLGSTKHFTIIDRNYLENLEFYKKGLEAISLMEQKSSNAFDKNFHIFVDAHIEALKVA